MLAFGEHGIGKRTLIRQLLHDQLEIFYVAPIPSAAYPYEPLVRALHCQDDPVLKDVLAKSTAIGCVFDEELLRKPFDIPNADQMLQKIEELSRLIKHEQSGVYTFDSIDSYNLISLTMSETENRKYHGILAEYFKRVLENQLQLKGKLRPKERL